MTMLDQPAAQGNEGALGLAPEGWPRGDGSDPLARRKHGATGRPLSRVDGPLKVSGGARFAAEFPLDGMVYAAIAFSTVAKGRIAELDTTGAEAAPGVVALMTHLNAPRLKPLPAFMSAPKAAAGDGAHVLQDEHIRWNGQPIAVVLAETQEQADHAASLVRARYEQEVGLTDLDVARAKGTHGADFMGEPLHDEVGDPDAALAAAAVKVEAEYRTPFHNHNAIELHAVTVAWEGDRLRIHDASQLVSHAAWTIAQVFGVEEKDVVVTSPFVGGGFGGKTLWHHQIIASAAAKLVGRPVRLMLSREGVYRMIGGRAPTEQRVALGADRDGRLKAIIHTGLTPKTATNAMPEAFIMPTRSVYAAETLKLDVQVLELDMLSNTFMRAPGESVGTFALEVAMDELAEALGMDPIELRLKNEPEKDPITGQPFSQRDVALAYRLGAERFGWSRRNPTPGQTREGDWLVGLGCATATYPYFRMPGGAARITITGDGRGEIAIAAHEMGMGTATAHTQVTADRLGLPVEQVRFDYGDSTLPGVVLAGGSQQTASIGASIIAAHRALLAELLRLAGNDSPLAGLSPDEVACRDAGIAKLDEPERFESYASILHRAQRERVTVEAEAAQPEELGRWSMHSHGALFCEMGVHAVTGELRVRRFTGVFDCGRILNAKTAASQFRGGIIMGLGMALMEETQFDPRKGRVMNPSLAEYHVPVHMDVPEIEVLWTGIPDPHTPMGARGVGEIGITGTAAAVANAVHNATGKRVRDLPITLDKLL